MIALPRWLDAQEVSRWLTLRCAECGHRFRWRRDDRHSFGGRDRYHGPCIALRQKRREAEERLEVLAMVLDVTGITTADLPTLATLRVGEGHERSDAWNQAWRVAYALDNRTAQEATA